jgi:hypothetical protein
MIQAVFQAIASYYRTVDLQIDTVRIYCDNDARFVRTFNRIQLKTWWVDKSTHVYVDSEPGCLSGRANACKCNLLYIHYNYNMLLITVLYRHNQPPIRDALRTYQHIILRKHASTEYGSFIYRTTIKSREHRLYYQISGNLLLH